MPDQDQQQGGVQTAEITGTVQIKPPAGGTPNQPQGGSGDHPPSGPDEKPKDDENQKDQPKAQKNPARTLIIIGVLLLIALVAAFFYWRSTFTESTDDAQVNGNLYQVSARVAGQVIKVYVEDDQTVQPGQVIAEIDPKDYIVALEQAQANLASTRAASLQARVNVPITGITTRTTTSSSGTDVASAAASVAQAQRSSQAAEARVTQARANAVKAQLDVDRYTPLVQRDVISKQQYDAAVASAAASRASVLEAEANVIGQQDATRAAQQRLNQAQFQAAQAQKTGPEQIRIQQARAQASVADVQQAQARVDQAQLNLGYTKITAPTAGIIDKKNVVVGANLAVGQDLLTIVPLTDMWVTANFKETQLNKMKSGQHVTIKVDALKGRKFTGQVTQIGGATGSRLSLFPPENATGNYVKVVQRIPVRIDFTNLQQENGDYRLRVGMSVTPAVDIK